MFDIDKFLTESGPDAMVIEIGDGLPESLTAERIKGVLALANSHERILKQILDGQASKSWVDTGHDADLYDRLWTLLVTDEGREAYAAARSEFENRKTKWHRRADLFHRILENCAKELSVRLCFNEESDESGQDLVSSLAAAGAWERLAEAIWVKSLILGQTYHLLYALIAYPDISPYLEAVQAGLTQGKAKSNLPDLEGEGEAGQLVDQVKNMAEQLAPDNLIKQDLHVFSQHIQRLTKIAGTRSQRVNEISMLLSQIESWEKSRSKALSGNDTVVIGHLVDLKASVSDGNVNQETVTKVLGHAEKLLSIESRYYQTQSVMTQASMKADFDQVESLLDIIKSIRFEINNTNKCIAALLDGLSLKRPIQSGSDTVDTTNNLKSHATQSETATSTDDKPDTPLSHSVHTEDIVSGKDELKQSVRNARQWLVGKLCGLGPETRLGSFIKNANIELEELYAKPQLGHSFTQLRLEAGFDQQSTLTGFKDPCLRAIGRLLHVDDKERLDLWHNILTNGHSNPISKLQGRQYRLGLMLFAILGRRGTSVSEADHLVRRIQANNELRQEYCDLLEILSDRIRTVPQPINPTSEVPLASHATYTLGEIMAAHNHKDKNDAIHLPQSGVIWNELTQTDLLFITLKKSDKEFSPTTRYADYPLSPTLFHWESQNQTTAHSRNGQRYIEQTTKRTNVILFVREQKTDRRGKTIPYHCLGRAHYQSHQSEKPMKIVWNLERPMPGWLYMDAKVVAG